MAGCTAKSTPRGPRLELARCTVVLLVGGESGEREISLRSGEALQVSLLGLQHAGRIGGFQVIEVLPDGRWGDGSSAAPAAAFLNNLPPSPLFFLGLHGGSGEDGTLQGLLRGLGLPFTGSGVGASALCMDKQLSRLLFMDAGIAVAPGCIVPSPSLSPEGERTGVLKGEGPWFVKPRRGGSSLATTLVEDWSQMGAALKTVEEGGDQALVELAIPGVEVTVGLLDQEGELPRALPLVEVRPHAGHFFDFEEKYSSGGAEEVCPPQSLSPERCHEVSHLAQKAFRLVGCAGYARIDFIVPSDGPPVCLEINTLPGFTARSLLPMAAKAAGISFDGLVELILGVALEDPNL